MSNAIAESLKLFQDDAHWGKTIKSVPIFVAHDLYQHSTGPKIAVPPGVKPQGQGWTLLFSVDDAALAKTVDAINYMWTKESTPMRLQIGHTVLDQITNQKVQPDTVGYGSDGATLGKLPDGRTAVLANKFCYRKERAAEALEYQERSPEFNPVTGAITALALLKTDPKLKMGMLAYQADVQAKRQTDATMYEQLMAIPVAETHGEMHYARSLDSLLLYSDENPGTHPDPTANPGKDDGIDPVHKDVFMRYMQACYPHLAAQAGTPTPQAMQAAPPAAPPVPGAAPAPGMAAPPAPPAPIAPPPMPPVGIAPPGAPPAAPHPAPQPKPPGLQNMQNDLFAAELAKLKADFATLSQQYQATAQQLAETRAEAVLKQLTIGEGIILHNYAAELQRLIPMTPAQHEDYKAHVRLHYQRDPSKIGHVPIAEQSPLQQGGDTQEFGYSAEDGVLATQYMTEHPGCDWEAAREFALKTRLKGKAA
jgi:hypothetical protein